jgi:hypothetical protein
MACPLYSKREQDCLLLNQAAVDDEESVVSEAERVRQDFCLGDGKEYAACPVFRQLTIERAKAY